MEIHGNIYLIPDVSFIMLKTIKKHAKLLIHSLTINYSPKRYCDSLIL